MNGEYPNYPLIEERFLNSTIFKEKIGQVKAYLGDKAEENPFLCRPDLHFETFWQEFPNTAGIFESGGFSGQAFIRQYITIVHDYTTDIHMVFGGNRSCYAIFDPSDNFWKDIQTKHMATLKEAAARYEV